MIQKTRNTVILVFLVLVPAFLSVGGLSKGQVIKQFFAFSITQSLLGNPLHWLSTTLPCEPSRIWVEEVPIYHFLSALFFKLGAFFPDAVSSPISILSLLIIFVSSLSILKKFPIRNPWFSAALISLSPGFLRYSFQHLPDLFATSLALVGLSLMLNQRRHLATFVFMLSVATKANTIFAIVPILIWDQFEFDLGEKRIPWKLATLGLRLFTIITPFVIWLGLIAHFEVPSPFSLNNGFENRHSGPWALVFDSGFWSKFFTWNFTRGIGWVAFGFMALATFRFFRNPTWKTKLKTLPGLMMIWSLFSVVYWILVRQGNLVHDYYSLPFLFPFLMLALQDADRLVSKRPKSWLFLAGLHLIFSLVGSFKMEKTANDPVLNRPKFCQYET